MNFLSLKYAGTAALIAIIYIDPGNIATNMVAGSKFGFSLLNIIIFGCLIGLFIQTLSAKLSIISGHSLTSLLSKHLGKKFRILYWIQAELVIISTDIGEFLGSAIGMHLLFGISITMGFLINFVISYALLLLQSKDNSKIEIINFGLLAVIGVSYIIEIFLVHNDWLQISKAAVSFNYPSHSLYMILAIFGAIIMPHAVYLHSGELQNKSIKDRITTYKKHRNSLIIFMFIATLINLAGYIMAANSFFNNHIYDISNLKDAYITLKPLLGSMASNILALTLIISGISSSILGVMAGQHVLNDMLHIKTSLFFRRLITIIPTLMIVLIFPNLTSAIVMSQFIINIGIPFALIPLIIMCYNKKIMGKFTIGRLAVIFGSFIVVANITMNLYLVL